MPREADFDYAVVGSGAGGGPIAVNLARAGMRVLLLEAGGTDEDLLYRVPCFHGQATEDEAIRWDYYVRHYADDDRSGLDTKFDVRHDGVWYPRAGTLGGCTAHNAMITVYGTSTDWDAIARETGDASWNGPAMRGYFQRLERCTYYPWYRRLLGNRRRHGLGGWLSTSLPDARLGLHDGTIRQTILGAAEVELAHLLHTSGLGWTQRLHRYLRTWLDPNDVRVDDHGLEGLWLTPLATAHGRRNGTREHILEAAAEHPDHLVVKTHALVTNVVFDDTTTAVGVDYLDQPHAYAADPRSNGAATPAPVRVLVRREVILAGGAFSSPQLLKLSGIGPRAELERHGIDVRSDRPGVGENLQDRYEVGVVSEFEEPFEILDRACAFHPPAPGDAPDPCLARWEHGEGVYTSNGAVLSIVARSRPELAEPDLFVFGFPAAFRGYYRGYSSDLQRHRDVFTWAVLKAHTENRAGSVRLRSADPTERPAVNFRYFEEGSGDAGRDLDAVVAGVRLARAIVSGTGRAARELTPGAELTSDDELRDFVRREAWGHHASCTCRIGASDDPAAVVDSAFRVIGTQNLRVVDASVFPRIPGYFIVTPTYMISEKASDAVLADAGVAVSPPS